MKRFKILLIAIVFGLAALLGSLPALAPVSAFAQEQAASAQLPDLNHTPAFVIENANFGKDTPSKDSETLTSWTDWTSSYGNDTDSQGVKSGVVDVTAYASQKKNWGLKDETFADDFVLSDMKTEDGKKNSLNKALLVNSENKRTVYKYQSADLTIAPNSYLNIKFRAYVRTSGNAYFRFSADELSEYVLPLPSTDGVWKTFSLFFKSSSAKSVTTKIVFELGTDAAIEDENGDKIANKETASGYFFLNNITSRLMTPGDYATAKAAATDSRYLREVFFEATENAANALPFETLSESDFTVGSGWKRIDTMNPDLFGEQDKLTLKNPGAPFSSDGTVFGVRGTDSSARTTTIVTKDALDLTVPRFGYLRISVWVNTENLKSGSVSVKAIKGTSDDQDKEIFETSGSAEITSVAAQNKDSWTGGWGEAVILVKGSPFSDITLKLSLGVTSLVGEAYFDAPSYTTINGKDYETMKSDSAAKTLEADGSTVADVVTNGNFNSVGASEDDDVLLPASDWTVDATDKSVSGILGIDDEYFNAHAAELATLGLTASDRPAPDKYGKKNVLAIVHQSEAATSYKSSSFSAPTYKDENETEGTAPYHRISVNLANLLERPSAVRIRLCFNDKVIAEIRDATASSFTDYVFDVATDTENGTSYSYAVEIAVGDKADSSTYTKGTLWLNRVFIENATAPASSSALVKSVDLSGDLFSVVKDSDTLFLENYAWESTKTVDNGATLGFVKTTGFNPGIADVYKEMFRGAKSEYAMLLNASSPSNVGYTQSFPIKYTENTYVKVTLRLKTRGFESDKGATIKLGDKATFRDVNTEYLKESEITEDMLPEYNGTAKTFGGWREYSFYINVNAKEETNEDSETEEGEDAEEKEETTESTITTAVSVWIGESATELRAGTILVDGITVTKIDETIFAEGTKALDNKDEDTIPGNILRVNFADPVDTTPTGSTTDDRTASMKTAWIVIASVLGGIVLIILLVMLFRSLRSRRRERKLDEATVSYDRSKVEKNYRSGAVSVEEDAESDTVRKPSKQARTIHGLKRQQARAQQSATAKRRKKKGLSSQQDRELVEKLKTPKEYRDDVEDFED